MSFDNLKHKVSYFSRFLDTVGDGTYSESMDISVILLKL